MSKETIKTGCGSACQSVHRHNDGYFVSATPPSVLVRSFGSFPDVLLWCEDVKFYNGSKSSLRECNNSST